MCVCACVCVRVCVCVCACACVCVCKKVCTWSFLVSGYKWFTVVGYSLRYASLLGGKPGCSIHVRCLCYLLLYVNCSFIQASADKDSEFADCLTAAHAFFKLTQVIANLISTNLDGYMYTLYNMLPR